MNLLTITAQGRGQRRHKAGSAVAQGGVSIYQRYISRDYNAENDAHCMYTPSCSHYMQAAVQQDGLAQGTAEGLMRIARCMPEVRARRMQEFRSLLVAHPDASLRNVVDVQDNQAWATLQQVQGLMAQQKSLSAAGREADAQQVQNHWTQMLETDVEVHVQDLPGQPLNGPTKFEVEPAHVHDAPSPERKKSWMRSALTATASVVGAVTGAVLAGGIMGGIEATVGGVLLAPVAGLGKTDAMNASLARKYGADSVYGAATYERAIARPAFKTYQFIKNHTGSNALARTAGVLVGIPTGLVLGLVDGIRFGVKQGGKMGRILAHNVTDDGIDWMTHPGRHARSPQPAPSAA